MKKALYLLLCINSNNDKISIPSRESSIQFQSRRNSLVAPPSVDGLAKASSSDLNLASDRESPRSSQRRGSLTGNSVRQSRSESVMAQRPLVSALLVGEHLRKEKAKQSRTGDVERQKSKIETVHFAQVAEFLNDPVLDPEIMLNAIQKEESSAKARILALTEMSHLLNDGFFDKLHRMISRAFLAAVFGLIQNPLVMNTLENRLAHYHEGVENARGALKAQIAKLWREIALELISKISDKSATTVYSLCGITLKWQETDLTLLSQLTEALFNADYSECDLGGLIILSPRLILQLNSGQLKLEGLQQIATIGVTQSILLAVGAYADSRNTALLNQVSHFLLSQLTDIWTLNRPTSRRENFEMCLADLLAFIGRILWNEEIAKHCATKDWILALLHTLRMDQSGCNLVHSLRPRLLAVGIIRKIAKHVTDNDIVSDISRLMLEHLSECHWLPLRLISANPDRNPLKRISDVSTTSDPPQISGDCRWNSDRLVQCSIEEENLLIHSTGGRGYGLASDPLSGGRHVWKIDILNEARGNEGTCIGVSKFPVTDCSHRLVYIVWVMNQSWLCDGIFSGFFILG